ncbi:MAG: hypothetical protein AABZ77_04490 [Chloroflexota bacterium]
MVEMIIRKINRNKKLKSQAYFWTKEWQEGEKQADEDIKAGRVKVFRTMEEALAELDRLDQK